MKKLLFFVEHRSSLTKGLQQGIVYRNMAQYERFLADGDFQEFYWFSYDPDDHAHLERLRNEKPFWKHLHLLTPPRFLTGSVGLRFILSSARSSTGAPSPTRTPSRRTR